MREKLDIATLSEDKSRINIILTDSDNRKIGSVLAFRYGKLAVIETMFIDSDHRKNNLGTELLEKVEFWAKKNEATKISFRFAPCDLLPSDSFLFSKFFLKKGYKFVGIGFIKSL